MGPPMTPSVSARREWRTTLVLVAVGSTISFARADMVVIDSMQPWETCAECHSLDGISVMARSPKLAGQRPDYIAKQVRDFRDGRRRNDGGQMAAIAAETMPAIAAKLSDRDVSALATFLASQPRLRV